MSNSPYFYLDRLIEEFEEDSRTINSEKLIMINYPKVFVMTVASSFEREIKKRCRDFINSPILPISTYTDLDSLINYCNNRNYSVIDKMYAKFYTYNQNTNSISFDASKFYELFGGVTFRNDVEVIFTNEIGNKVLKYQQMVDQLYLLVDSGEQYERDYVRYDDILARLKVCTFSMAETAFLNIKYRRNKVAHDYINGLSDTFNDLSNFYFDAVIYVISIEKAIINITNGSSL